MQTALNLSGLGRPALAALATLLFAGAAQAQAGAGCKGEDGIYGIAANNYRIEVKFADDSLTVIEPNRTSTYRHVGNCQFSFTHPNGTVYMMGVTPRGLLAYKPGQSDAQKTPLALLQAKAAPPAAAATACKGTEIPVENPASLHPGLTRLYGTRTIDGVNLVGTYKAPERDGRPMTVLNADGTGVFEVYGAPKPQFIYNILSWHIQVNCDGTLIEEDFPVAKRYYIVYQLDRPYQGRAWQRDYMVVRKNEDRVVMIDRSKPKQ